MPYSGGRKQIIAIYLSIKRTKGKAAADRWLAKHKGEMKGEAKRRAKKE